MVINTNVSAMGASRLLANSSTSLSKSLARLSSGSKLISPEDDAAGLAQSMKFEAQINRNNASAANVGNATSFSQTVDGFLTKVQKALDRMSELTVLAQDVTKTTTDLSNYTVEFAQLQNYISDIGSKQFNGVSLFASTNLNVTINSDGGTFAMTGIDLASATVTVGLSNIYNATSTGVSNTTSAAAALNNIKTAIQSLANMRANVGASIQRLNLTGEQLNILNENLSAANSRIKDVDVAEESTSFARYNILVQSGTAMLSQANMLPQSALRLLG
jgi:flagellin